MFYVYILRSLNAERYYVGSTCNLKSRLERHNRGGSVYTKNLAQFELVWSKTYNTRAEATREERRIKRQKSSKYIDNLICVGGRAANCTRL